MRGRIAKSLLILLLMAVPAAVAAQTTGTIRGRVIDQQSRAAIAGADVRVVGRSARTSADAEGRFILGGIPAGEFSLEVSALGYQKVTVEGVLVRPGRATEVDVPLAAAALSVEGIVVQAERVRLIEPHVSESRTVMVGDELRDLPTDNVARAIELAPGVSGGHFRGGKIGQESYVVDGIELKNQLQASRQGYGIEFSPNSLEEVEVITGGFGAEYGSALSGVVSYVTRRGDSDRWRGRASLLSDQWAPDALFLGFTGLTLSGGGPLDFLGQGTTIFADFLAQGFLDAEPRARGLTCLAPDDAEDDLAARIRTFSSDAATAAHYCPFTSTMLPHQPGEKQIGFVRIDRPLGSASLSASFLHNRFQRQLYTPEFKYNAQSQLGQSTQSALGTLSLDWTRHAAGRALHVSARGAAMRLDRYVGALSLADMDARSTIAGFGFSRFEFLGADYVRSPVESQIAQATPVPGHEAPGGSVGSPFGPAGEGIFFTTGTPHIANWSRVDLAGGDLAAELTTVSGAQYKGGVSGKAYRVENYERVLAHLPVAALQYTRFYPATASTFFQARFGTEDDFRIEAGIRAEAFRSGIAYREDRGDFLAPVLEPDWKLSLMPRIAMAAPIPGTDGRSALRFNYGMVSQPPDFRYFLDSSIGDSLRADIQRQGNPNLAFERGTAYEAGLSQLIGDRVGVTATVFLKQLRNLATNAAFASSETPISSLRDYGSVRGIELSARARTPWLTAQAGYALQKAVGVSAGTDTDTIGGFGGTSVEYPLAFDRRHSADLALFFGRAAGRETSWSGALLAGAQSGYPIVRAILPGDTTGNSLALRSTYMPWTSTIDLRLSRDFGSLPGCARCAWKLVADGRNLLGSDNVIGVRRETGLVAPRLQDVEGVAALADTAYATIPREDPRYSAQIDANADGRITDAEFRAARFGAALDRYDPSIFYAEPRQLRLGVEVTF